MQIRNTLLEASNNGEMKLTINMTDSAAEAIMVSKLMAIAYDLKGNRGCGYYIHPDDIKDNKKNLKAVRRVLHYFLPPPEFDAFNTALEQDKPYDFSMEDYIEKAQDF